MYGFDKGVLKDNKEIYSIIQANKTVGGFVKKYLE